MIKHDWEDYKKAASIISFCVMLKQKEYRDEYQNDPTHPAQQAELLMAASLSVCWQKVLQDWDHRWLCKGREHLGISGVMLSLGN